jgi:hypothetical protein
MPPGELVVRLHMTSGPGDSRRYTDPSVEVETVPGGTYLFALDADVLHAWRVEPASPEPNQLPKTCSEGRAVLGMSRIV